MKWSGITVLKYSPSPPNGMALVQVLAEHYREHPCTILSWLGCINARELQEQIAATYHQEQE